MWFVVCTEAKKLISSGYIISINATDAVHTFRFDFIVKIALR